MTRFNPSEINHLLDHPSPDGHRGHVPEGFFDDVERRILDATVHARPTPRHNHRLWWSVAAAVLVVLSVGLRFIPHPTTEEFTDIDDLYALSLETSDEEAYELDEIYECDIFLEEL